MGLVFAGNGGANGSDNDPFRHPTGVAVNASGHIYVADQGNHRVQVYDKAGTYQYTIGVTGISGPDNAHLRDPYGVAVNATGYLYVADFNNHRVQVFDKAGTYQYTIGETGWSGSDNTHLDHPSSIAVSSTGRLYVADFDNHRVQVFDEAGQYWDTIGMSGNPGSDDAHLNYPEGVAVNATGHVYVADRSNNRVQVFSALGIQMYTIGETGVSGSDNAHFNYPKGVAVNATGHVYIADAMNHRVQVFDKAGTYQYTIGKAGISGPDNDHLNDPKGIGVNATTGHLYVADYGNSRVQVFDKAGKYVSTLGVTDPGSIDWVLVIAIGGGAIAAIVIAGSVVSKRHRQKEPPRIEIPPKPSLTFVPEPSQKEDTPSVTKIPPKTSPTFVPEPSQRGYTPPAITPPIPEEMEKSFWKRELPSLMFLGILSGSYAIFVGITGFLELISWDEPTIVLSILIALTVVLYYFTRWEYLEKRAFNKLTRVDVHDFPPSSPPPIVPVSNLSATYGVPFSRPEFINLPPTWRERVGVLYKWYLKFQAGKIAPVVIYSIYFLLLKTVFQLSSFQVDLDFQMINVISVGLTGLCCVSIYFALRGRVKDYTWAVKVNNLFENLLNDLLMRARSSRAVDLEEVCHDHGFRYNTFLQKITGVKFPQFYDLGDVDLPTRRFILNRQYAIPIKFDERLMNDLQQEVAASGRINLTQFCHKNGFDFKTMQSILYQYAGKNEIKGQSEVTQTKDYIVSFDQGADSNIIADLDQFVRTALDAEITGAGKKKGGKV